MPFKWRGFWDFGTGAIGDMGIHNLDTAYWGLELGTPTRVAVECSPARGPAGAKETAPLWSIIELQFPARGSRPAGEDDVVRRRQAAAAGAVPRREAHHHGRRARSSSARKGTLFTRTWHGGENDKDMFVLLPRDQFADYKPPEPTLPRAQSHHQEWVDACRGHGQTLSPFAYAAVLTESLLLGNVALRTRQPVEWDRGEDAGHEQPRRLGALRQAGVPEGMGSLDGSRYLNSRWIAPPEPEVRLVTTKSYQAHAKSGPRSPLFLAHFFVPRVPIRDTVALFVKAASS